MARTDHCDQSRLKQLLTDKLPESVEKELSEHIGRCPDCQHELESLAANDGWWTEASQRLSRTGTEEFSRGSVAGSSLGDDVAQFATDFAVDFLAPTDDPKMLGRLGEYEIVEVIGRGGMGIVLKGYQKELQRHVAVKVLSPHLATSGAARRRFAREAQATAAVVHPHVMAIHAVQANAKLPYLVMPYVACESLQERLDHRGPLDVKDVLRIGMQAALGLAAAHAQGLVHRDVKPANILLETNVDRVLLTDFGLARAVDDATLTRTGIIAGTPQYMSPEQANGDGVDHRSDIFSLGGVLYAMCAGRPPFRAETTFGVLRRIRETSPRSIREINPDIPAWLEQIVLKLLEKDVSERLPMAQHVATLLEQCLAHVQNPTAVSLPQEAADWLAKSEVNVRPNTTSSSSRKTLTRRGGVLLVVVIGSSLVLFNLKNRPIENRHEQVAETATRSSIADATTQKPDTSPTLDSDSSLEWNATSQDLDSAIKTIDDLENDIKSIDPGTYQSDEFHLKENQ